MTDLRESRALLGLMADLGLTSRRGGQALAPHGTLSAYSRHLKDGTEPCADCRRANTEAKRSQQSAGPKRPGQLKPIRHGTRAGYRQHRYRREQACEDCLRAERERQAPSATKSERFTR